MRWVWWLSAVCWGLEILREAADLQKYRDHIEHDYLLLRSGDKCSRCDAIEHTMKSLNRHIEIPVVIAKYETNADPVLEYHQWGQGKFTEEPYEGQLNLGSILKYLEGKLTQAVASESNSINEAVSQSHANSHVPFVALVQSKSCAGMVIFNEAVRILRKSPHTKSLDFWYVIDSNQKTTMGQITVTHPGEMRLASTIPSTGFVVDWIRKERFPQFGKLTKEMVAVLTDQMETAWIILVGDEKTYDLFQHEVRLFSMYHREEWRCGFVSKNQSEYERILKKALNVDVDVYSLLAEECEDDCLIVRQGSLIRFFETANLSEERLTEITQEVLTGSTRISSLPADLRLEHDEIKKSRIQKVLKADFVQKILKANDPLLLLLHEPDDIFSQELKSVFVSVADSLQMKGIKFYEMTDLPPPDTRYIPESLPHLWFKPVGKDSAPLSIPWQKELGEGNGQAESKAAGFSELIKIAKVKAQKFIKSVLMTLRNRIDELLTSAADEL